jgi:hypothetical protein
MAARQLNQHKVNFWRARDVPVAIVPDCLRITANSGFDRT